jgi:[acyl-carrier-protein] S-malonyltransferase
LSLDGVSNVTISGGTLEGERDQHQGTKGEWGHGIRMERGTAHITVSDIKINNMWGDGIFMQAVKSIAVCPIVADHNRRQGISVIEAEGVLVTNSVFKNTRGTALRTSARTGTRSAASNRVIWRQSVPWLKRLPSRLATAIRGCERASRHAHIPLMRPRWRINAVTGFQRHVIRPLDSGTGGVFLPAKSFHERSTAMAIAFVFPGQGSQDVGMGRELAQSYASAREVFEEVDAALGQNLSQIMWEGPKETLTLTENAQPALMAVSMAVMRVLEREHGFKLKDKVKFVAGHSLGEYSALAAAGAFSLTDAARLLKLRGQAMQAAVPVGKGAMTALLGVGVDAARKVAEAAAQGDVCQVANDNEPTQVVLSGDKVALDRVPELGKAHGVRRAVPLPVSAPFHCALMQPAADAMREALAKVTVNVPVVPVIANVLAQPISDPEEIKKRLVEQVTGTVRWRECVTYMTANGVTDVYEIGAGKVLAGLAKRIDAALNATSVGTPADVDAALARLNS